jgi:23S rRNA (uracil1939-C5)-methyltransferase
MGGEAVSKDLGIPVFIAYGAPGDLVEVEIFDARKDFLRGKILKILEPARSRIEPPCGLFGICGGCQLQHLSYAEQLVVKKQVIGEVLEHIGGLAANLVEDAIPAEENLHYRNKVQYPVRNPKNSDRLLAGYYKSDSHELVNVKHCPVQPLLIDRIIEQAKILFEEQRFRAYDERTGEGLLRHINARYSFSENKALLTFVLKITQDEFFSRRSKTIKHKLEMLAKDLMAENPELTGVYVNFNNSRGNRILGNQFLSIAGAQYIEECLASNREDAPLRLKKGINYRLSPSSFFQVNSYQAVKLFELVRDAVTQNSTVRPGLVVDAYAGVGAMSLWLADSAEKIIAIEEHPDAVADGEFNAHLNNSNNIQFIESSTDKALEHLYESKLVPDVILVDPPRKGLSASTIACLLRSGSQRIVYVSCNPATLARDLKLLGGTPAHEDLGGTDEAKSSCVGYKAKQIQPIDLFPHTHHIESVTILERFEEYGSIRNLEKAR